jgi:hypothetical protein
LARIRLAITKAKSYGANSERGICQYVDTSFLIGPDFDNDSAHEWARRLLSEVSADPDRTIAYVNEVAFERANASLKTT